MGTKDNDFYSLDQRKVLDAQIEGILALAEKAEAEAGDSLGYEAAARIRLMIVDIIRPRSFS